MMPDIGKTVLRNGTVDWLCQIRLGEEQFVLFWGGAKERYKRGDKWTERSPSGPPR